ncbi:MAG: hypothetical protein R6U84_04875 [Candidatus Cloacimonadales bacterium]
MIALLDALGATVVGAMFMLTILTSTFNIQAMSANYQRKIQLVDQTERITSILDYYYLSAAGAGLTNTAAVISEATATSLVFRGELDGTMSTIALQRDAFDTDKEAYPLVVRVDGTINYGPFWVTNSNDGTLAGMNIAYFDENESAITYSDLGNQVHRNRIRMVRVELELFYETYRRDLRAIDLKHQITFWKYFTNLYL